MLRVLFALLTLGFIAPLAAEPVRVVVSFSILEDWVKEVGGSHVEVTTLVGRNSDAHAFRPSPSDAKKVANADLLVVNGLGFEGWMSRLIEAAGYSGEILIASNGIEVLSPDGSHGGEHDHADDDHLNDDREEEGGDPHAWHSIGNAIQYVRNIERGLTRIDPKNSHEYSVKADDYIVHLHNTKAKYAAEFAVLPNSARKAVTSHNAFVYLADDYGIELLAPQSSTTGIGSSAKRVAGLVERIRHENIRALFLENVVNPRMLEQVSEETGVAIGGRLYSDALSDGDGEAPTYLLMMQHNMNVILEALR